MTPSSCIQRVLLLAVGFTLAAMLRGADEPGRGRLTESVACAADPAQRYAIYVPSRYTADESWPVIFAFDAGARGVIPVQRLQEAAERYGYIVAGSLNSRNGPWSANAAAAKAMATDVAARFSTDPARTYSTGLSGGARVATQLALNGFAKGVIACGATFPSPEVFPDRLAFAYFATAGVEDFNYGEVRRLVPALRQRQATFRVVIFEGGHEWAPAEVMTEAVAWLELQAMRREVRPRDEAFLEEQLRLRRERLPPRGLARCEALHELLADFADVEELAELRRELEQLDSSAEVRAEEAAERTEAVQELALIQSLADAARLNDSRRRELVGRLRDRANGAKDPAERLYVRRALIGFSSTARETARDFAARGDTREAIALLEVATLAQPRRAGLRFELARVRALHGDRRGASDELIETATLGFSDVARVESEPAFAKLRQDPRYTAALVVMRRNPPEPSGVGWRWVP